MVTETSLKLEKTPLLAQVHEDHSSIHSIFDTVFAEDCAPAKTHYDKIWRQYRND
jgi:hypothetical protein